MEPGELQTIHSMSSLSASCYKYIAYRKTSACGHNKTVRWSIPIGVYVTPPFPKLSEDGVMYRSGVKAHTLVSLHHLQFTWKSRGFFFKTVVKLDIHRQRQHSKENKLTKQKDSK